MWFCFLRHYGMIKKTFLLVKKDKTFFNLFFTSKSVTQKKCIKLKTTLHHYDKTAQLLQQTVQDWRRPHPSHLPQTVQDWICSHVLVLTTNSERLEMFLSVYTYHKQCEIISVQTCLHLVQTVHEWMCLLLSTHTTRSARLKVLPAVYTNHT